MYMEIIQILAVLFALFALSRALLRMKDGRVSVKEFMFWGALWILVIVVAFIPGVAGSISLVLGIERPVDALVYSGIILLFYLMFRIYVKLDGLEQEITEIVKQVALRKKK